MFHLHKEMEWLFKFENTQFVYVLWGGMGKGHQGICIKDTWPKPKGVGLRVEGGDGWGWGE